MNNLKVKRPTVIVIENNYMDMLVLRALLRRYVNLCIAPDLEVAAKIISEFDFDMILLNVHSYNLEKNDLNIIKEISKNKDIKVCGLSSQYEDTESRINKGFNDVLTKPVCKEDIFKVLNWQVVKQYNFSNTKEHHALCSVF